MKTVFIIIIFLSPLQGFCQDPVVSSLKNELQRTVKKTATDTTKHAWKKGGLYNINIAQSSLSNWAAGGDDFSLSVNSLLSLFACYKKNKISWDNSLDINLGYMKTSSLGSRKNDDRFDLLSKSGYSIGPKINLAGLFDFRSQFFKGYNYYYEDGKNLSSDFLSPAYLIISAGLDFKPWKNLSVFLSPVTTRWVIVKNDSLAAKGLYGLDSNNHSRNEMGAFATINYQKTINKTINYRSRLDLLSNYEHNPQNIDVYMSNLLTIKLARLLSVTWSVDVIYDDDAKIFGKEKKYPATQLKSLVGIGLLVKI